MVRGGYDEPRGVIVGTHYMKGVLTYDGRPQGYNLYGESQEELLAFARKLKRKLLEEYDGFTDDSKWVLRIWD